ncbi:S8 family serine peptidase [Labedella phragmitis]|uniref:S8 family serine peptidase n=1 Tax=Labedella phragmitis TaxID=2498849 RepID=UPI00140A1ADD|nr:S8 family serine peptidase [Labedella phragmitis]
MTTSATTPVPRRARTFRLLAAVSAAIAVTAAGMMTTTSAIAAGSPATIGTAPAATPLSPEPTDLPDGRYIVTLRDEAVATYGGGLAKLPGTAPTRGGDLDIDSRRVVDYSAYLERTHESVADSVDAIITTSYTITTNGFSSALTGAQAAALTADPRVASVVPDELLHLTATSSTDFLGLGGDGGVWEETGGVASAGEGIVIGVIDSGIAPENPSFDGDALGSAPGAAPYLDGDAIVFEKSDGGVFRGACESGDGFDANDCNTKLVTARYFVDNYGGDYIGHDRGEYLSPRDGSGHGSHTSSTAAGDADVTATVAGRELGAFSGVVPGAKIAMYKACWTGPTVGDDGCATGDLLEAIDAAVADGVDVINYSIGGGAAQSTLSITDQAFLRAASVGVFVAASAGNDGPGASTADNAAPWITTAAASTIPSYEATVRLGDGTAHLGGSITVPTDAPVTGPVVEAAAVAMPGAEDAALCAPDTLDPSKTAGTIVLCDRGIYDRVAKSAEVERAGGIGVVLVNPQADSLDLDTHSVPTVHVDAGSAAALHAYARNSGATATLEDGNTAGLPSPATPQVAGFSSRGPILADGGDVLKPDVTAPGVAILAAYANADDADPAFALLSGTSMASPHVAGLAALYLGEHPAASPAEIKSALMTTAYDTVGSDGATTSDPFAQGAGHVDPTRYVDPGMLYLNDTDDWYGYAQAVSGVDLGFETIEPSSLNLPSISVGDLAGTETVTRTVTSTGAATYTASPVEVPGITVSVSPTTLTFDEAGQELQYTVTFTRTDAPLDAFATGNLRWTNGDETVTTPLAVRPVSIGVPAEASGEGVDGSVEIPVSVGTTASLDITETGLVKGDVLYGAGRAGVNGAPSTRDRHVIQVPEGTTFARFALDASDDTADLDLHLFMYDEYEQIIPLQQGTTPNADETLDVPGLSAGRYLLEVDFYAGDGDLDYSLTSYLLGKGTTEGALTATPEKLEMTLGEPASVTATWAGLEPGSHYFGRIGFGNTGHSTNLTVTTPGSPVAPTDELALMLDRPWARAGTDVAAHASGLIPGGVFTLALDGTTVVTGFGSAGGTADRAILLPADLAEGEHVVTVTTADGSVDAALNVSELLVFTMIENTQYAADGAATTGFEVLVAGSGDVHVTLTGSAGVLLDEDIAVASDPMFYVDSVRSSRVAVSPGVYTAEAWATASDGSLTQRTTYVFTVELSKPSDITIAANPDDADFADLTFTNRSGDVLETRLRYKLCSGPVVFTTMWIDETVYTETFDMTGATSVELLAADDSVLAFYENEGPARCAADPAISQDFWVTFADGRDTTEAADEEGLAADEPIEMTFSNRYPAWSGGFDFTAGTGNSFYDGRIYEEQVSHDVVTEAGPVVEVPLAVSEGDDYWVRAKYEVLSPDIHISAHRVIYAMPVTLAMLAPVADGEPGDGGPGDGGPGDGGPGDGEPGDGETGPGEPGDGESGGDAGVGETDPDDGLATTGGELLGGLFAATLLLGIGFAAMTTGRRSRDDLRD